MRLWLHRPPTGVVAANTFFMSTLCSTEGIYRGYNYSQVANWMSSWGRPILDFRRLLVPVNHENVHWFLLEADMSSRTVKVYDSLGEDGCGHSRYTEALCRFLHDKETEAGRPADGPWLVVDCASGSPRQNNGYDCGIFTILNGYLLSRGVTVVANAYTQETIRARSTRRRLMYLIGKAHDARAGQARQGLGNGRPRGAAARVRGGKRTARAAGLGPDTQRKKRRDPGQDSAQPSVGRLDVLWGRGIQGAKRPPESLAQEAQRTLCEYFGTEPKRRRTGG